MHRTMQQKYSALIAEQMRKDTLRYPSPDGFSDVDEPSFEDCEEEARNRLRCDDSEPTEGEVCALATKLYTGEVA